MRVLNTLFALFLLLGFEIECQKPIGGVKPQCRSPEISLPQLSPRSILAQFRPIKNDPLLLSHFFEVRKNQNSQDGKSPLTAQCKFIVPSL